MSASPFGLRQLREGTDSGRSRTAARSCPRGAVDVDVAPPPHPVEVGLEARAGVELRERHPVLETAEASPVHRAGREPRCAGLGRSRRRADVM